MNRSVDIRPRAAVSSTAHKVPLSGFSSLRMGLPWQIRLPFHIPLLRLGPKVKVPVKPDPLWFEKGWTQSSTNQYTGAYRAAGKQWRGLIQVPFPGSFTAYIWNPPMDEIGRYTTHRPCFIQNGEAGRHNIYFHSTPTSLEHVITSIEKVLDDACRGKR